MISEAEFIKKLDTYPLDEQKEYLKVFCKADQTKTRNRVADDFMEFIHYIWPEFIGGEHHKIISEKFNKIASGEIKRLIVNMPPRHTKSEFASNYLPAWMIGKNPKLKIIQATHTAELAIRFGRKAKHVIDSPEYQEIFETSLQEDSKAAGRWETAQGGEYFAVGVGGAMTGRGADLLIIDDPHKEKDLLSKDSFNKAYEWYTSGPRQRLQPGGRIVLVMTRWSTNDLTGQLMKAQGDVKGDQWEVVEFPAVLNSGRAVWPQYWTLKELDSVKASISVGKWNAQYMQTPTAEEGAIIKREWWKDWPHDKPPKMSFIIQSYDTAFLKKETADYSAVTTWGIFHREGDGQHAILLDAFKGRYEFPELRRLAHQEYLNWQPDIVIIEAKASGIPLLHELRQKDIPVQDYTPSRGNDKHARMNSIAHLFQQGRVWAPKHKSFAQEVIEECAAFPHGEYDDYVDSMTQAIMRLRGGYFLTHPEDYKDVKIDRGGNVTYYG